VKLQELKAVLRAVDPAAVLVSPRLLSRVIQEVHHLPTQFLQVPHHRSFVIDRQSLFRHVEQDELDLDPDRLLPATVVLLIRPTNDDGVLPDRQSTLLKYWQRLFHANVDRALEQRIQAGKLTGTELRARIAAIGEAEFDEIRSVLAHDLWLLPPVDDLRVYCEFVAVYLELRYFLPKLRPVYFPALRDFKKIDAIIAQDVDAEAIYRATRLPGAPDPRDRGDGRADDSHEYYWRLVRTAEAKSKATNHVRAAILRTKAARVAPGALTADTRNDAHMELQRLAHRLQAALTLTETEAAAWHIALVSLLEKADQGAWTVEARFLYDLQQVCIDNEREVYKLDVVEWILSAGKRPIKRPLPSQRLVQMTRHLRTAGQRIPYVRLSDNDRQHLTTLMQAAQRSCEEQLRVRFRPVFTDAFHDVGLFAGNPPEETAFRKMIEELLDRIVAAGFFNFGDLRDVVSRNNLKLPDLADPQEFVRGDPLLRLDRYLASKLDGVYKPGEIYLRALARGTSLFFGTRFGRFVVRNVLLPFVVPFLMLYGLEHFIQMPLPGVEGPDITLEPLWSCLPIGLFLLGLIHLPRLRRLTGKVARATGDVLVTLARSPAWLMRQPAVQRLFKSWLFQLVWWYAFKPLTLALLIWLLVPHRYHPLVEFGIIFFLMMLLLNSRLGHAANEIVTRACLRLYDMFRADLIAAVARWIMDWLKWIMDALERVLYSIDEWLRFRSGDSRASLVARAVLGILWYPIAFFTRLYIVILVEPMFHPLKLPIAILAAKVMYPVIGVQLTEIQKDWLLWLAPWIGPEVAYGIAGLNTYLSPNFFGFLFWELRENWRLYRANRSRVLRPVMVGHHGESMVHLLRPGFHSGTVPRLFNHLRRAERVAMVTSQWRTARAYRHQLLEVEEAVRLFVERELLVLLHQSQNWPDHPLRAAKVELATHLIRIELEHSAHPGEPVRWAFAEKAGWLTVQVEQAGWLPRLTAPALEALKLALAGWYKLAGVDLVREQVQAGLAGTGLTSTIEEAGLSLRSVPQPESAVLCPMYDTVRVTLSKSKMAPPTPIPPIESLVFARIPIRWQAWVDAWLCEQHGKPPCLLAPAVTLLPADVRPEPGPSPPEERNGEGSRRL
jgi:hypothetical protein